MIVIPVASDHVDAASGLRYSAATGRPRTLLAAASMKPRTISSGAAPRAGGSGSTVNSWLGRSGAWVICTVGELVGTMEQDVSASSTAAPSAGAAARSLTAA